MNPFLNRKYIISAIFGFVMLVFVGRLFYLQVIDKSSKLSASNNVLRYVTKYPARGLVFDRHGKLLVYNEAAYDLMIVPNQVESFDTLELAQLLDLDKSQIIEKIKKAKRYSYYKPSVFEKQLSAKTYAPLQEKLHKYKGFFAQTRTLRRYPEKIAANVLGYVSEVTEKVTKADSYYKSGDYIGDEGVEKSYEKVLRGRKGMEIYLVDVHNRIKGRYKKGKYDTVAIHGGNIGLTIDASLQKYGEKLMQNKLGSIVALDPSNGEILTLVSSPSYNSELLVGRVRSENYQKLVRDTLKPLFNRPIMARYPPGSTFKTVNALISLQEKIITPSKKYRCLPGYAAGRFYMGCHVHKNPLDLTQSIQNSCNAYYAHLYRELLDHPKYNNLDSAFNVWRNHLLAFNFGRVTGVDLPHEKQGYVPTINRYHRIHGKRVRSLNVVSMSIGQGELLMTPMQMANMAAIICNKGFYFKPHIIKYLPAEYVFLQNDYHIKQYTKIDSSYFAPIIEGMYLAVNGTDGGTAHIAKMSDIEVCGKTGTAQNPGKDHSIFIAFAPKENPKIAIAVYVENGGFGARWAAPIASLMIEKYIKDNISRNYLEQYVLNGDLINGNTKK